MAETNVFGSPSAAAAASQWFTPKPLAEGEEDPFAGGGGFEWPVGLGAKTRKKLKATSRPIPESKRTEADYYNSESWSEPVKIIQHELIAVTKNKEDVTLHHEQARIKIQAILGKPKPAKMVFIDIFWGTQTMTDAQLMVKGENGRPLKGKQIQSKISMQLLKSLLKAAGQDENLVSTGGFGAVKWDALIERNVTVHIEKDSGMDDELRDRVQRFSKSKMG